MIDLEPSPDLADLGTSIVIPRDPLPGGDFPISNRKTSFADFRTRMCWQSLSPARRDAIRSRRRFYTIPYVRHSNEPSDDFLP